MSDRPNKIRITIVDDDQPLRDSLATLLQALGFATETHACVTDFIIAGGIHRTECLILDLIMPDIDGFTLQMCLRDTNAKFPVIVYSGRTDENFRRMALANGAFAFLPKPVKRDQWLETLRAALPHRFPSGVSNSVPPLLSSGQSPS